MRSLAWALLIGLSLVAASDQKPTSRVIEVSTALELVEALREPLRDTVIQLAPGNYHISNRTGVDFPPISAGHTLWPGKAGLVVTGSNVGIQGSLAGDTVLEFDAEYGFYFSQCRECELARVTLHVTAPDSADAPAAGNTAVLVNQSTLHVINCKFAEMLQPHYSGTVRGGCVAIKAIESGETNVAFCEIGPYDDAIVVDGAAKISIRNNLLSGFGAGLSGGSAVIVSAGGDVFMERNLVQGFNFEIQVTSFSSLVCRMNIIENISRDGITALTDTRRLRIEDNIIFRCGGAGLVVQADGDQIAGRNIIVETGKVSPRPSAIYVYGSHADAAVRKNTLYSNTVTDAALDRDVSREAFWRARRPWTRTYRNTAVGVDGRHKFYESAFLTRYGRWAD